jgi:hypothetical protein
MAYSDITRSSALRASWVYRIAAGQFPLLALAAWPVAFVGLLTEGWVVRLALCMFLSSVAAWSLAKGVVLLRPLAGAARATGRSALREDPGPALMGVLALVLLALGGAMLAGLVAVLRYA